MNTRKQILLVCKFWGGLWLISLCFGFHGFSLPVWSEIIHEPGFKPLIGKARGIRSDSWAVLQPLALSQSKAFPPFPVVNSNIGEGMNMLLVVTAPVKNQVAIFRPHTWGHFINGNFGTTWCWNFYVYSFLFSFFFLFLICTRNAVLLSAIGAVALLFSPFFQFWSLNCSALAGQAALSVVLAILIVQSTQKRTPIVLGVGLGWTLACFAYWLYPAFQVPVMWVSIAIFIGLIWRMIREGHSLNWTTEKTIGVFIALLIPTVSLFFFFSDAKDAIAAMYNTVYPGQRFSVGGGFGFWQLFSNNLIPFGFIREYKAFGNICEAGSSLLVYPIIFAVLLKQSFKEKLDPLVISLSIVLVVLTLWTWVPMPHWVALLTGFSRVPSSRSIIGHAFANIALVVTVSSLYFRNNNFRLKDHKHALLIGTAWVSVIFFFFPEARAESPNETGLKLMVWILYAVGVNFLLAYLIGLKHRYAIGLLCLFHLALSGLFNPVVRGGAEIFETSGLARALNSVDSSQNKKSKWAVFGDSSLASFTRAAGLPTVNGVHLYPQQELWSKLDAKGQYKNVTNRYAHVRFIAGKSHSHFSIESPQPDVVEVKILPSDPRFLSLDVDFVLSQGILPESSRSHWILTKQFESYFIYKRNKL